MVDSLDRKLDAERLDFVKLCEKLDKKKTGYIGIKAFQVSCYIYSSMEFGRSNQV